MTELTVSMLGCASGESKLRAEGDILAGSWLSLAAALVTYVAQVAAETAHRALPPPPPATTTPATPAAAVTIPPANALREGV